MHKSQISKLMPGLDRRHFLTALGAGLVAAPPAFAAPTAEPIARRLAQVLQDGRVSGLHALLVSQGGRLLFEHYGGGVVAIAESLDGNFPTDVSASVVGFESSVFPGAHVEDVVLRVRLTKTSSGPGAYIIGICWPMPRTGQ